MLLLSENTGMKETYDFGPVVKRLRLAANMTQEELCAATDYVLQPGYLSQLERHPKSLSFNVLNSICRALGVPISDMIREADGGEQAEFTGNYLIIRDSKGDRTGKVLPVASSIPANSFALKIDSTSMESKTGGVSYFKGGFAIVTPCDTLEDEKDYVFRIDEHLTLARYQGDGRRHVLTYLNPSFPPEALPNDPVSYTHLTLPTIYSV